jgi:hypothetical protein
VSCIAQLPQGHESCTLPDVDTHHVSGLDRAAAERDFKVPVNPHPWYKLLG